MAILTEARTMLAQADHRITLQNVSWEMFEGLLETIEGQNIRVAYDEGELELMSPGAWHEDWKVLARLLIETITDVLQMPRKCLSSLTWRRPDLRRAIEADESYYLTLDKINVARHRSNDSIDYPPPDLVLELDVSPSQVDRPAIYAALGVPEIWRFDGETLVIDQLRADGSYQPSSESRYLPIRPEEVVHWIVEEDSTDQTAWARRLRAWVQAEILPRQQPRAAE